MDVAAILAMKFGKVSGWEVIDNVITKWPEGVDRPTQENLEAWWPEIEAEMIMKRIQAERQARYAAETDGLFFKAMRGEIPLEEWEAAIEKIREELPYPNTLSE